MWFFRFTTTQYYSKMLQYFECALIKSINANLCAWLVFCWVLYMKSLLLFITRIIRKNSGKIWAGNLTSFRRLRFSSTVGWSILPIWICRFQEVEYFAPMVKKKKPHTTNLWCEHVLCTCRAHPGCHVTVAPVSTRNSETVITEKSGTVINENPKP